jgi:16S rRNA (cytidine1402-2'-O)-methyltransferase
MPGTLFVVATPIGNLEDLTFRALRILGEVDLIAAEDTRRTAKLLARYDVRTSVHSFHAHNEARQTARLLGQLERGQSVALVSDAGTPGIADPGARLVAAAHQARIPVVPVPGPSAIAAALSASGFEADRFIFMGFPPASGSARRAWFEEVSLQPKTVVFFESPHRIMKTLGELSNLVIRPIVVWRELSKIHESMVISPNAAEMPAVPQKGEFTVVLGPARLEHVKPSEQDVYSLFCRLTNNTTIDREEALALVACSFGISKREATKLAKKGSISAKRQKERSP